MNGTINLLLCELSVCRASLLNIVHLFVVTEFLESKQSNQKTPSTKRPKVVSDMTEEEQLNAAIAASLGGSHTESGSGSGAADSPVAETQDTEIDEETAEEERQASIVDTIEAIKREEPTDLKNSTRIQFRLAGTNWSKQIYTTQHDPCADFMFVV